ncbi:MAG: filamentous hemagglutinin N-terminal domain-containing protein, partial [Acetobacteraceae bacterium]|nr:filamentous hemagglutinin N-terminal domain-containing protein [Acetobacteraceae bacterium]
MPRRRSLLLSSTALLGLAAAEARGQAPTPNAGPVGGQVVAGQAAISRAPNRTTVNQGSDRAAIDWQQFNVGRDHTVQFVQPSRNAWTLNRVTGPDPSVIAGRIQANGGVALVNPAGVLFSQGSQVNVGSLIATPSDITNENFMAGRMRFDGPPRPGARVENHGEVTVAERGLVVLAGPRVANTGTIRARMGRVALQGGAEGVTLDLAGDGLLSIDVTRAVREGTGGTALVTNTGVIEARGGSVVIGAHAASGLVEDLVDQRGAVIAARVRIRAEGGNVALDAGRVTAPSGQVEVSAGNGTVRVGRAARVSANGRQAGTVQIGGSDTRAVRVDGRVAARGRGDGARGGKVALQA